MARAEHLRAASTLAPALYRLRTVASMTEQQRLGRTLEDLASAAERHGVTPRTIRRRIADGTITGYRSGPRLIRVDPAEVDSAMLRPIPSASG